MSLKVVGGYFARIVAIDATLIHAAIMPKPFLLIANGRTQRGFFRWIKMQYFLFFNAVKNKGISPCRTPIAAPYRLKISCTFCGNKSTISSTRATSAATVTSAPESLKYTISPFLILPHGRHLMPHHRDSIVFSPAKIFCVNPHDFFMIAT